MAGKLTGDPELRYEKGEIIGKGSFGIVYKGTLSVEHLHSNTQTRKADFFFLWDQLEKKKDATKRLERKLPLRLLIWRMLRMKSRIFSWKSACCPRLTRLSLQSTLARTSRVPSFGLLWNYWPEEVALTWYVIPCPNYFLNHFGVINRGFLLPLRQMRSKGFFWAV
jgi:hypothetical protein